MGRVSRQQADLNRQRVVETACRLFRERGPDNVSIADVMEAAGLTPGGFYKQFESREALAAEAYELAFQQSGESWQKVREDAHAQESGAKRRTSGINALIRHYFRRRPAERNCPILTFAHPVSSETAGDDAGSEYAQGTERLFEQFRDEAQRDRAERGLDALTDDHVRLLFAAMIGTGLLTRAIGEKRWIRELQNSVLNAVPAAARSNS